MPSSYLDRYGRSKSICHRLPARLKLVLTLVIVLAGAVIPVEYWPLQGVLASLVFIGHSLAHIPISYIARRLAIFLPMVLVLSISLPASQGFEGGWELMTGILFRSTLAFITVLWLVNVMPFDQLLVTLGKLWVPNVIVAMLAFMYRYVFVLWDELDKMRAARRARSFGSAGIWFGWRTSTHLIGMLLIRAMGRAERVHGAMCARGWDGHIHLIDDCRLPIADFGVRALNSEFPITSIDNPQSAIGNQQKPASSEFILRIDRLSYRYPTGFQSLDDVTFSVADGEVIGIVGPSGAGKSTLLMHLNGLLPEKIDGNRHTRGTSAVEVAGLAILNDNLPEIRRLVGFLFQDPDDQLFCPTVREDVAFGPVNLGLSRETVSQRVSDSLAAVGLSGYEHRSTLQLSVGERKRVCLAGVLACRPSLLALDEPTGNLDPRARQALLRILRSFEGSQIIATHDLDLVVEHCQRVIVLDEGKVRADGPPRDVLADKRLMEQHGLEVPLRIRLGDPG